MKCCGQFSGEGYADSSKSFFFFVCKTSHQKYWVSQQYPTLYSHRFFFFFCIYPRELELRSSVVGHCVAPPCLSTVAYLAVGQASEVKKSICLLNPPTFFPTCQGIFFGSDPLEPCLLLKLFSACAELLFVQSPTCTYIYRPVPRRLHYHSHVAPL